MSTSPSPPREAGEAAASPGKGALEPWTLEACIKRNVIFPGKSLVHHGARSGLEGTGAGQGGPGGTGRSRRMLEKRRVYVTWGGGSGGPVESRIPGIRALRWVREAGGASLDEDPRGPGFVLAGVPQVPLHFF